MEKCNKACYNIKIDEEKYQKFRRYLHTIPEIKYEEKETQQYILSFIQQLNNSSKAKVVEVKESTGFWVDIIGEGPENTTLNSKNGFYGISFRCDLDALPITEETGVEYSSKHPGKAHSCGHDGHMTLSTCFLDYILQRTNLIPKNVLLRFIYQPAEEGGKGAVVMINNNCLEGINEIYGIHNLTLFNVGEIGLKVGPVMSSIDFFNIEITGKGGHGSRPDLCCSPITTGSEIVLKLNQITSQRVDSKDRCIVSVGSFVSGGVGNVIPDKALIQGTTRTFDSKIQNEIADLIKNTSESIALLNDSKANVSIVNMGLITDNNADLTTKIVKPAIEKAGFRVREDQLPLTASEDFSFYQHKIPGVFIMLGAGDEEHSFNIHSPYFDYNDLSTPFGVEAYARILEVKLGIKLV